MADEESEFRWFPGVKLEWSFDVVGLLAIIGESSIEEHSQAITASLFGLLPRLIPAPFALLKPTRPGRMPSTAAKVTGVHSGITLDSMGYFANIITPLDEEPVFGFKVLDIEHSTRAINGGAAAAAAANGAADGEKRGLVAKLLSKGIGIFGRRDLVDKDGQRRRPRRGSVTASLSATRDEEAGVLDVGSYTSARNTVAPGENSQVGPTRPGPRRRMASRAQDFVTAPSEASKGKRPAVPPSLYSPIHVLGGCSFLLSIAIVVMGIIWKDGNAILSIALISSVSTIVGFASFWRPILMERKQSDIVPPGDVVIRTREGAFVLIRCTEEVSRELYSGTEECEYYVNERAYRFLMGLGTIILMISMVLLGNCQWNSQVFIGGSYIVLNGLYWTLGMLPKTYFWDLSRYTWTVADIDDARAAHLPKPEAEQAERLPSFTRTLWYAIRETKRTDWVETSGAAPATEAWKRWLAEAEENAVKGNRGWNAVERKNILMKMVKAKAKEEQKLEQVAEDE